MTIKKKTISLFGKLKMRYYAHHQFFLKPVWPERLLKYRFRSLIAMAVIGVFISICFYKNRCLFGISEDNKLIISNLTLLFLSLPVLVLLWYYRTHDVQQQIDKAQSNINTSLLNKGIDLLLAREEGDIDVDKRSAGLIMLAKLRQQDEILRPQIDALTRGVDLTGAKLQYADLHGIQLSGAILTDAKLQNANLKDANLKDADLRGANLENADLQGANLKDADLRGANLENVDLQGANLQVAKLESTKLPNSDFNVTKLPNANLKVTKLSNANLKGANLKSASLHGADLRGANLESADLENAEYSKNTEFPEGFDPEGAGMKLSQW